VEGRRAENHSVNELFMGAAHAS
jgi:hypothetical protein